MVRIAFWHNILSAVCIKLTLKIFKHDKSEPEDGFVIKDVGIIWQLKKLNITKWLLMEDLLNLQKIKSE